MTDIFALHFKLRCKCRKQFIFGIQNRAVLESLLTYQK